MFFSEMIHVERYRLGWLIRLERLSSTEALLLPRSETVDLFEEEAQIVWVDKRCDS